MANEYLTQPVTGRSDRAMVQPQSTAIQAGIVLATALAESSDVVNDRTKSGKQKGAVFTSDDNKVYIASGDTNVAPWHVQTNGTAVTPA